MTSPISQTTGFFRFPARVTTRLAVLPLRAVRTEWAGSQAPCGAFRIRHGVVVPAPSRPPKVSEAHPVPEGVSPRITLRV